MLCFLNGRPAPAPAIGITDAGFAIGEGVFETMVAEDGRILRRNRHIARMAAGCEILGLPPADWDEVDAAIAACLRDDPGQRLNVRLMRTRGPLAGGFGSKALGPATSVVTVRAAVPRAPTLTAALIDWPRRNPHGIETRFKSLGYGNESVARAQARALGADVAIMLAVDGQVSCADTANLFLRFGDTLVTPDATAGPLCGTVRAEILDNAARVGVAVETGTVTVADLQRADAIHATNAGVGICPVSRIVNLETRPCHDGEIRRAAELSAALLGA